MTARTIRGWMVGLAVTIVVAVLSVLVFFEGRFVTRPDAKLMERSVETNTATLREVMILIRELQSQSRENQIQQTRTADAVTNMAEAVRELKEELRRGKGQ